MKKGKESRLLQPSSSNRQSPFATFTFDRERYIENKHYSNFSGCQYIALKYGIIKCNLYI